MHIHEVFAINARMLRARIGISQMELSRRTGIPQNVISKIEKGKGGASLATVAKLAEGLRQPPAELLSLERLNEPETKTAA